MDGETPPILSCPQCGGRRVGRLGGNHYYCGDCCLEMQWNASRGRIDVFDIDEEGNLTVVGSHPVGVRQDGSWTRRPPAGRDVPPPVH